MEMTGFGTWRLDGVVDPAGVTAAGRNMRFPVYLLSDPELAVYQQWGMGRASYASVWFGSNCVRYLQRYVFGGAEGRAEVRRRIDATKQHGEDTSILGADFVLERCEGTWNVVFAHYCRSPTDRPPIAAMLAAASARSS